MWHHQVVRSSRRRRQQQWRWLLSTFLSLIDLLFSVNIFGRTFECVIRTVSCAGTAGHRCRQKATARLIAIIIWVASWKSLVTHSLLLSIIWRLRLRVGGGVIHPSINHIHNSEEFWMASTKSNRKKKAAALRLRGARVTEIQILSRPSFRPSVRSAGRSIEQSACEMCAGKNKKGITQFHQH